MYAYMLIDFFFIFRGACLSSSGLVSHSVCLSSVFCRTFPDLTLLSFLSSSFILFQVLLGPLKSFQVLQSPSKSLQVLSSPPKSFQVLSSPSKSFQLLSCPSNSFQVLSSPSKFLQVAPSSFKGFQGRTVFESTIEMLVLRVNRLGIHLNVVEFFHDFKNCTLMQYLRGQCIH